ncbi:hypothetical protein F2Q69_00039423 [Brassica cretica]|uniref:JmjC domain-containing protein n=1 Tax=Brassica cretica TaxID=69181 RepID=A0A8S9NJQ4_BRACR|nr:hypothetical protein F2Q69_00039423 [Brassica cretica]
MHCNGWPEMLKLKDWPPSSSFEERLQRHNDEFISALPFFDYTDPESGILNLTARLGERFMKRNLGPKIDIAYGFPEELNRGDSVTKLHWDTTDSVLRSIVLTHTAKVDISPRQYQRIKREQKNYAKAQLRKQYAGQPVNVIMGKLWRNAMVLTTYAPTRAETRGNASESSKAVHGGAVWDIFRREDVPKLIEYLKRHKHEFRHINNQPVKYVCVDHPIIDQTMFLSESQKKQLKKDYDIEPWTFEQHLGEAVFIPAGKYLIKNYFYSQGSASLFALSLFPLCPFTDPKLEIDMPDFRA